MFAKIAIFALLWKLTGNPILALIILLIVLYFIDRQFIGLFPNLTKPFRLRGNLKRLRQEYDLNPHHVSSKAEAARILIQFKRYREARRLLEEILPQMEHSAEVRYDYGWSCVKTGDVELGEQHILEALKINSSVRYGEPYLRLGEAFAAKEPDKALKYLKQFGEIQSSSCEAYYVLGNLYHKLGRPDEEKDAYRESLQVYRLLPKYRRKQERRWAFLSLLKRIGA